MENFIVIFASLIYGSSVLSSKHTLVQIWPHIEELVTKMTNRTRGIPYVSFVMSAFWIMTSCTNICERIIFGVISVSVTAVRIIFLTIKTSVSTFVISISFVKRETVLMKSSPPSFVQRLIFKPIVLQGILGTYQRHRLVKLVNLKLTLHLLLVQDLRPIKAPL